MIGLLSQNWKPQHAYTLGTRTSIRLQLFTFTVEVLCTALSSFSHTQEEEQQINRFILKKLKGTNVFDSPVTMKVDQGLWNRRDCAKLEIKCTTLHSFKELTYSNIITRRRKMLRSSQSPQMRHSPLFNTPQSRKKYCVHGLFHWCW